MVSGEIITWKHITIGFEICLAQGFPKYESNPENISNSSVVDDFEA
jgi:hypothetical protein